MSSKFFAADSDNEGSDNEAPVVAAPTAQLTGAAKFSKNTKASRHRKDEEDSDEDVKRVVVSQKDKAQKEINEKIASIQEWIQTNDWPSIFTEFGNITKVIEKSKNVPENFVQFLVTLEDAVNAVGKETKRALAKTKAKGLTSLTNALKTYTKTFESEMAAYREAHVEEEEVEYEEVYEEVYEEEEGVEYEEVYEEVYEEEEEEVQEAEEEEEVEEEEGEEEEEEVEYVEEEEEEEEEVKPAPVTPARVPRGRDFWLKSNSTEAESDSSDDDFDMDEDEDEDTKKPKKVKSTKDKKAEKKEEKKAALAKKQDESKAREVAVAEEKQRKAAASAGAKEDEFSKENIDKSLAELILKRGKKNFDRKDQIDKLNILADNAKSPEQEITILFQLISIIFDISNVSVLTLAQWRNCSKIVQRIFSILKRNAQLLLTDKVEIFGVKDEEEEGPVVKVGGRSQLLLCVERLEDEITKSFLSVENHAREYIERLRDESVLLDILATAQDYYAKLDFEDKKNVLCRFAIKRIEHSYYKINPTGVEQLTNICGFLYANGDQRLKTRAVLCQIYSLAIHDQFYLARDILLKSHLQENIHHMEPSAQIQLNRVIAQLGLCAFRKGLIWETHSCLADLYSGSVKAKELLAQGVPRFQDRNLIPQEMIEKLEKRLVPYHMHISLDMLECAHLTSAMLLEVPNMAAMNPDSKRKVISRPFRKNLEHLERNVFSGPPETTRDYVMAAAKALANADWKKCRDLINNLSVWRLIPNSEQVKVLLTKKIQEEGLFTYLLRFGSAFDSISIETLADTFELPSNKVFSIVSKMIGNEDLSASFDGPSNCLIMHKSEASRLQSLALSLTEKAQHLVELNERILELKTASQASQRNEYHNDVSNINSSNINAKGHHQYNQGNNQRNRGMQGNRQGQNRQNNRQGQGNKSHGNRQNNPRNQNRK